MCICNPTMLPSHMGWVVDIDKSKFSILFVCLFSSLYLNSFRYVQTIIRGASNMLQTLFIFCLHCYKKLPINEKVFNVFKFLY